MEHSRVDEAHRNKTNQMTVEYNRTELDHPIPYDENGCKVFVVDFDNQKKDTGKRTEQGKTRSRNKNISKKSKIIILSVALILNMMSFGFVLPLSVIYVDVIEDLGVTRAEASLLMSVTRGVMFGTGFLSSFVYHKIGPIKCVAFGGIIFSVGLLASTFAYHIMLVVLTFGISSGIGGSLMNLSGISLVSSSFGKYKSSAVSFVSIGSGVSGFILPLLFENLTARFSWRGTIMIYSGLVLNAIPLAYLLCLNQQRKTITIGNGKANRFDRGIFEITEFWFNIITQFLFGAFGLVGFLFVVDLAEGQGYSRKDGALFASLVGISAFISRIVYGGLIKCSRLKGYITLPVNSLCMAGIFASFAFIKGFWPLFVSCLFCGITYGIQVPMLALVSLELVGTLYFPTGYGIANTFFGIGNAISGPIGGAIKDHTGKYDLTFLVAAVAMIVKCILEVITVSLKRRRSNRTLDITVN